MLTLAASIEAERVKTATAPITQVVITFPSDSYVKRIANVAHEFDGEDYYAELMGDVSIEWGLTGKFDNASFTVANMDRAWTDLLNTYEAPEVCEATVEIYETFAGLSDRIQIFGGVLELPKDVSRSSLKLSATHVLNNLREQFNDLEYSPTCQWAKKGYFGKASPGRCPYDGGDNYGQCSTLAEDTAADETDWTVAAGSLYAIGDYIQCDDEIVYISNIATNVLTVTRAQKSTTAATHSSGAKVLHQSCSGSYDACTNRDMNFRFGGQKFFPREGAYYYRQKMTWFISTRIDKTWKSQGNQGIFGTPWGVAYGSTKIVANPLYVRDPGSYAVFFASLGCGPIAGKTDPPSHYIPQEDPPGNACVIINGRPYGSAQPTVGVDGLDQAVDYPSVDQGYSWLWTYNGNDRLPIGTPGPTNAATFSRMAYIAGMFPSDVTVEEGFPEVEVYLNGRIVDWYSDEGVYTGSYWTNNPAWIFVDMLINPDYGAGLSPSDIDFPSIGAAKVDFDNEGMTFNAFLSEKMPLTDVIALLCNSTRSYPTYTNGKIGLKVIKSSMTATALSFDASDYVQGSCKYWVDGPVSRDCNVLKFSVEDYEYDYQSVPVTFVDQPHIDAMGGKKKEISLKITGITDLDQAENVGAWHMNLAKMARRQDGAVKLTLAGSLGMPIQPGDIITVDASAVNGFSDTQYLVWNVKRTNNNGNRELGLLKWDTGLFDLYGIDYATAFSGINPNLDPLPVEDLAATVTDIGDNLVQVRVTWTWPDASPPTPRPVRVFLFAGHPSDPLGQFDLWTPGGVREPVAEYTRVMPRAYSTLRIFAAGQSAFRRPQNPGVYYTKDDDCATALNETLTATDYVLTVDDASQLDIDPGDFLILPMTGAEEIVRVSALTDNDITAENNGSDRTAFFGTTAIAWADDSPIYKLAFTSPYVDLVVVGTVQSIPYVRAYDYLTDTTLAKNQIRVKIPRDSSFGDKPTYAHIQLYTSSTFPEPVKSPQGAGDGYLEANFGTTFLVPDSYDLSGAAGKLLVLIDEDGATMGRYIQSIAAGVSYNGLTWSRVTLNGYMPRMAGTYDWEVWSLWYQDCDYSVNVTLTDAMLDLSEGLYDFVVQWDADWTGHLRAYLLTEACISAGVLATDAGTGADTLLHLGATSPSTAPGVPLNVTADHSGRTIIVRWDPPATGAYTLTRYLVRISPSAYVDDGDGTYSMSSYTETQIAAGVTEAHLDVSEAGQYGVAVLAVNAVGTSDYAIYWQEA